MPRQSTRKFTSTSEAECPDCGVTLSRRSDLKRHRKTQHPDGTEVKFHCPHDDCDYKADQKSNLNAHTNARHSNALCCKCSDCGRYFTDPAAQIRHRKKFHGYKPYHTPDYFARQARKKAEKERGKAVSKKALDQQAASVVSHPQNGSLPAETLNKSINTTYHDDLWKLIVDDPRRHASEPNDYQGVQIGGPVTAAPARGAPKTLHSAFNLSSLGVGQLQPSTMRTRDGTSLLGSQLRTTVQPQSQASAQSWTPYNHPIPVAAPDPFATAFRTLDGQSTYPDMGFPSLPTLPFANIPGPSSMPNTFTFPTTFTGPSSSQARVSGHQFVPPAPNHMAIPPLEPVAGPSWTPGLSPANLTPLSQLDLFTNDDFNSWCQSYNLA